MHAVTVNEAALLADIEELRKRFPETKDLYREVAILLFFRHGQTPTTNRLYQLVRKGSMNTVTAALSAFWETLRERSRVQIDHPGIPEELKTAAGDLVQVLWEKANVAAKAEFDTSAAEASAAVSSALQAQAKAEEARDQSLREQSFLGERLKTSADQCNVLQANLESEKREHGATVARLEETRAEVVSLREAIGEARRDFATELDKTREAVTLAEERLAAAERRALLEIDRERTLRTDAEKEVSRVRATLANVEERANARAQSDAAELGHLRGTLHSAEAELAKRESDVGRMQQQISLLEAAVARAEGEINASRKHATQMEGALRAYASFAEHGQAAVHIALQAFQHIAAQWKLTDKEILKLLGAQSPQQITDWSMAVAPIPPEVNARVIATISVHRYLHTIFSDAAIADAWVRKKNTSELFGGRRALDVMFDDVGGLDLVRQYLAAEAAGNH